MPGKVAPLLANMPPKAPIEAPPARSRPPVAPQKYSTFIDVVLDHVCCAAEDDGGDGESSAREDLALPSGGQARPQSQPQHLPPSRPRSTGKLSLLDGNEEDERRRYHGSYDGPGRIRPELTILPHLRFHPLPSAAPAASSRPSSLRDFFDLFLADEAPHSFGQFHRSNGDDNVEVTSWGEVEDNETVRGRAEVGRLERNITFRTKISPGSSSNPLSSQSNNNNNSNNNTVIPLEVAVRQRLVKYPKTWMLECEFSFDFQSAPTSASIISTNVGVGKKLGTGLGQYLMSNVVRGTTVSVAVALSESSDVPDVPTAYGRGGPAGTDASMAGVPPASCHQGCHDGLMSCLMSHPLLLPPDGLCSSGGGGRGKGRGRGGRKRSKSNHDGGSQHSLKSDEPSRVGASLLSAIKARNAPDGVEFDSGEGGGLAGIPLVGCGGSGGPCGSENDTAGDTRTSSPALRFRERHGGRQEDVLSCSSRGSLKPKRIPSFETLSRAPSTVSMRRMILERDEATFETSGVYPSPHRAPGAVPSDAVPTPVATSRRPKGLSMRIEMELKGSSSGNKNDSSSSQSTSNSGNAAPATSLSSSFSRSASISAGIDDRVRRGLRKRVSRQWISWAEGWCMRLWEEERTGGSARRRAEGPTPAKGPNGSRRNVRPSVRRIGDKRALAPKNVWEPLRVTEKGSGGYVGERWMSSELEGECGVEVSCTILTPGRRSPATVTIDDNNDPAKSRAVVRKPSIKGGRRLLKSLSTAS